jgi:hypothetical protein
MSKPTQVLTNQKRSIRERFEEIAERHAEARAAVIAIEGELKGLQHICKHPNADSWTSHDYGGGSTDYFKCPDCGYEKIT